jgi:ribose/xylose/arabinose/galactoside ABC-type transport system permease subunit
MTITERLRTSGTYALFIVICIGFGIIAPNFATTTNLRLVLQEIAPVVISGAAVTFVMVSGSLDLSVGGVLEISGVVAADLSAHHVPLFFCFLGGIGVGGIVGLINGFLVVGLGINAVIATLGTWYVSDGVANLMAHDGSAITGVSNSFSTLGESSVGGIPYALIVMVVVVVGFIIIERKTLVGKYSVAIGSNFEGARLAGLRVDRIRVLLFMASGAATGLAGLVVASRLDSGQPTVGTNFEFEVIVAAVLGGVSLAGGRGTVLGVCVGAAIVGVIANALDLLNIQPYWQEIIEGLILVIVVAIDVLLKKDTRRPPWLTNVFGKRAGGTPVPRVPGGEAEPPDTIAIAQKSHIS